MNRRKEERAVAADMPRLAIGTVVLLGSLGLTTSVLSADGGERGVSIEPQPKMGAPLNGLTQSQLDRFFNGRAVYDTNLAEEDGLGPVFNQTSCGSCHNSPLGGTGSQTVTRFGQSTKKGFNSLDHLGGSLLQAQAINDDCAEEIPIESNIQATRVTNGMMGYGLVEAIPDSQILALVADPPGISGRAHMVEAFEDPGNLRVGRFGWKAQVPTVLTFSADAAQNELGLSNRFLDFDNDPNGINPPDLIDCDDVPDPEDNETLGNGVEFIDAVTDFQRYLTAPPQTPRFGMSGETIFNNVGCNQCHVRTFTTADSGDLEDALRNKTIHPYSDFLLHDMGLAADFIPQGDATGRELRTPPLWGVRMRDPMWHDGSVAGGTFESRILETIELHGEFGSEAEVVTANFNALSPGDKDLVIQFLDSLGRAEFDYNGDNMILLDDFVTFMGCVGGGPYTADDLCAIGDVDMNGIVDAADFTVLLMVYEGTEDCNTNGILDIEDIFTGASLDLDGNGVPDECEGCSADIAGGDGAVDVNDLLELLGNWGTDGNGAAIAAPFDVVDVADLLEALAQWGPCGG